MTNLKLGEIVTCTGSPGHWCVQYACNGAIILLPYERPEPTELPLYRSHKLVRALKIRAVVPRQEDSAYNLHFEEPSARRCDKGDQFAAKMLTYAPWQFLD